MCGFGIENESDYILQNRSTFIVKKWSELLIMVILVTLEYFE